MKSSLFRHSMSVAASLLALLLFVLAVPARAGNTNIWFGSGAGFNNWSTAANWTNATTGTLSGLVGNDDVKMLNTGGTTVSNLNSVVDASVAVGSIVFGSTAAATTHTTLITNGVVLLVTNAAGLAVGTTTDPGAGLNFTNTVTGVNGTLIVSNTSANISINQANATGNPSRANLDLSSLGSFVVSASRLGIGDGAFPGVPVNQRCGGNLILARTNSITLAYTDTLANYQTAGKNSAITMSRNSGNNPGTISLLQLGIANTFNVDSLNIGMDKSGNINTPAHGIVRFNPGFAGQNPAANFYGAGGSGTRVTWWSVGDGNASASSSNGGGGTNDFSLGTVNILANVMSLARDGANSAYTWAGPHKGVFIFTNGTVDVNTLIVGNQSLETGSSTTPCLGIFNVAGAGALLRVNTALTLGNTTLATLAGTNTMGFLNVTNGTVLANQIAVGTYSVTNIINLDNATLVVSNTLATNASGLVALNMTNGTLGLKLAGNAAPVARVRNLVTTGVTNTIQLVATPVIFPTYPTQVTLVKFTTWTGTNNLVLAGVPEWAPGATLVSNGANSSIDLSLPTDPRPVVTSVSPSYAGSPGDSISFTVSYTGVAPLTVQWQENGTNVVDGPTGSGSTNYGAATDTFSITNAQPSDSGNFAAVVVNAYGSATSSPPTVLVISAGDVAPIVTGPNNVTVIQGHNATISAAVAGKPVPAMQWQFSGTDLADGVQGDGSIISGSATSVLNVNNAQYPTSQGTYSLIATNVAGLVTNSMTLTVIVPPAISAQPQSLVVTNTQSASFTVTASGVPGPNYQWYKNGNPISGANSATYNIASASPSSMGSYYVQISNPAGLTNSDSVSLVVNSASLAPATVGPTNGATGICYDTPLYLTFNQAPMIVSSGKIRIYNVNNPATPVDTLDMGLNQTLNPTYAVNVQPRNIGGDIFNSFPVIINGNTAAIYPHLNVLTSNQTYYVTIDNGVFADSAGAWFVGISATNVWKFTTRTTGPANPTSLVVAADGSGDFLTVQGAVDSVPANNTTPTVIGLRNGSYREIVNVKSKHNLDFRGQNRTNTIIGYPNNNNVNPSGAPLRAMFVLNGNDCTFENLTITNTTPKGGSQAEAVDVEGTRCTFYNMELDSFQDTFLVHSPNKLVYFQDCLIQGDTDFNWGYGTVYYTNCEVRCLTSGGHVTQPRSPQGSNGFAFVNCRITKGFSSGSFDLGRSISTPTTPSEVLFAKCLMDAAVTGYASDAGTNFSDYSCSNLTATATNALANSTHLTSSDPYVIAAQTAVTWLYGWQPQVAPIILNQPSSQSVSQGQAASFAVTATGVPTPACQWYQNGQPIVGATATNYAIAGAVRTNAGSYTVVVSNSSGSVTSVVATLTYTGNVAPVANPSTYSRPAGYPLIIPIAGNLATNWSDADADPLALTGGISSTNGAAVNYDGSFVYYTNGNDVVDQIDYTIGDGQGGTAPGVIQVLVGPPPTNAIAGAVVNGNGTVTLSLVGVADYTYQVEATTDLAPPSAWTVISTNTADVNGLWEVTDLEATNYPNRFYRSVYRQ
jgi:pectin methylesterase-like acyl-CoA thioesterase